MGKRLPGITALLSFVLVLAFVVACGATGEDFARTAFSGADDGKPVVDDKLPVDMGYENEKVWDVQTDAEITTSPILFNSNVYFGNGDGVIYCVNAVTGEKVWDYATNPAGTFLAAPLCLDSGDGAGSILFVSTAGNAYCLSADIGTLLFEYQIGGPVQYSSPAEQGYIYIGSTDGNVYSFNYGIAAANPIWEAQTGAAITYTLAVPANSGGLKIYGCNSEYIFCLEESNNVGGITGNVEWKVQSSGAFSPSYDKDNDLLFVGSGAEMHCLNPLSGEKIWTTAIENSQSSSASISGQYLYVGSGEHIYCFNKSDGSIVWKANVGGVIVNSSPAVVGGFVYIGNTDWSVYCLESGAGTVVWNYDAGGEIKTSPVVGFGSLYIGSASGTFYNLKASESFGNIWPTYKRDNARTACE